MENIDNIHKINNHYIIKEKNGYRGVVRIEDNKLVVPFEYDCFDVSYCLSNHAESNPNHKESYILAGRNGVSPHLRHGPWKNMWTCHIWAEMRYDGVYDLYNMDGDFLFGGFSMFRYYDEIGVFGFFIGDYKVEYGCSKYDGVWLYTNTDKNLKSLLSSKAGHYRFFRGLIAVTRVDDNGIRKYNFPSVFTVPDDVIPVGNSMGTYMWLEKIQRSDRMDFSDCGVQDYSERDMLNEFLDGSSDALGNIDW